MSLVQLDVNEVKLFLSESNRIREEKFLRGITDNYANRLIFSDNTSTNGNLVKVCPNHPFVKNLKAVQKILKELKIELNLTTWLLLKIFTRGGIAHEAFHILFTDFRTLERMNREFENEHPFKLKTMHDIMNIGEDSHIELTGINYLPGLEFYIVFSNYLAYENTPTIEEIESMCKKKELPWINLFLHWAMMYAIMGKVKGKVKNRRVKNKINKTAPIFDKIRFEKNCSKRYEYAKEIYSVVQDLVEEAIQSYNMPDFDYFKNPNMPELKEALNVDVDIKKDFDYRSGQDSENQQDNQNLKDQTEGCKNNSSNETKKDKDDKKYRQQTGRNKEDDGQDKDEKNNSGGGKNSDSDKTDSNSQDGKKDTDNSEQNNSEQNTPEEDALKKQEELEKLITELEAEKDSVEYDEDIRKKTEKREEELEKKIQRELAKVQYSSLHRDIRIQVNKKFSPIAKQEKYYERIYNKHRGLIQKFANMFKKLIKDQNESWQTKQVIGTQLNTKRLADPKMRVWKRKNDKRDIADLSIQVLIDGSGSMENKVDDVIQATIILYEVAKKLNIPICIVEERAIYGSPKVIHNVLVDYRNYKSPNTKYNLLHLTADEGTREGVSLKWASAYQSLQPNKDKLIIVLADGNPEHAYAGQSYTGRISASDTKAVAEQVEKSGTHIVAIALGKSCYSDLKQIYDKTILCDDLSKLPEQMIRILKCSIFK